MALILGVDPGASAGYCLLELGGRGFIAANVLLGDVPELLPGEEVDEAVFEAQHSGGYLYRNGRRVRIARKSQNTLSFTAGRLFERVPAKRKFRIQPDDWRALLWPGSRRLPKKVVLARLEALFGGVVLTRGKARADVLEATGIAHAWLRVAEKDKEKYETI
jgi:hypothetical protein